MPCAVSLRAGGIGCGEVCEGLRCHGILLMMMALVRMMVLMVMMFSPCIVDAVSLSLYNCLSTYVSVNRFISHSVSIFLSIYLFRYPSSSPSILLTSLS